MKQKKKQTRQGSDNRAFHLMLLVPVILLFIYNILPIPAGILMAFQNFHPMKGFLHSSFVGLANFKKLMLLPDTWPAVRNTLIIAIGKIIGNLVVPISFALLLNEIRVRWFKRAAQTITYLPYFLSWVVLGGILIKFLSPGSSSTTPGLLNTLLVNLHIIKEPIYFLGSNSTFRGTMIISDIWKNFGYNTIIYLAALTGIDPTLYEAAMVDGAGKIKQTIHVTMPGIAPFIALMTIMSIGSVLNAGFDHRSLTCTVRLFTQPVISSIRWYTVWGLINQQYSLSAAVGLLKSVVSCILVLTGYKLADKYAGYKVW